MANHIGSLFHHIQSELNNEHDRLLLWVKGKHIELSAAEVLELAQHLIEQARDMTIEIGASSVPTVAAEPSAAAQSQPSGSEDTKTSTIDNK